MVGLALENWQILGERSWPQIACAASFLKCWTSDLLGVCTLFFSLKFSSFIPGKKQKQVDPSARRIATANNDILQFDIACTCSIFHWIHGYLWFEIGLLSLLFWIWYENNALSSIPIPPVWIRTINSNTRKCRGSRISVHSWNPKSPIWNGNAPISNANLFLQLAYCRVWHPIFN